jgi:dolichol kinase
MFIRVVNALLGLWLFASAFMGSSAPLQFINVLVVSILVMSFGMASILGRRGARRVNAALGAWLFISALALPHTSTTQTFHNVIMAVLLVITSLFPHVRYHRSHTAA